MTSLQPSRSRGTQGTTGMLLIAFYAGASYHPASCHTPTSTLCPSWRPHSPMEWSLDVHRWKRHIKAMKRDKRQRPKKITRGNSTVVHGGKADCGQRRGLQEVAGPDGWVQGQDSEGAGGHRVISPHLCPEG